MNNQKIERSAKCDAIVFVNPLNFDGAIKLERQAVKAARHAAELKRQLKLLRGPTIYANDNFGNWRSDLRQLMEGSGQTQGRRLVSLLASEPDDLFVFKPRHSCFYQTPLMLLLQNLQVRRLILTGLTTDMCVLFSAYDAYMRGFELWIPLDCAAANLNDKRAALRYMARVLKADVTPAEVISSKE